MASVNIVEKTETRLAYEASEGLWRLREYGDDAGTARLALEADAAVWHWRLVGDGDGCRMVADRDVPDFVPDAPPGFPDRLLAGWLADLWSRRPGLTHVAADPRFHRLCLLAMPAGGWSREAFHQQPGPWYRGDNAGTHPEEWVTSGDGVRHPRRRPLPAGELYRRHCPSIGMDFSFRRADPARDVDRLTEWMNKPRVAEFWEQAQPRAAIAEYLDRVLADPHLQPVIGCYDDQPAAYFEIYWAAEDRLGPYYDAHPYDRGVHLLVGEDRFLGSRFGHAWAVSLSHFVFLDDARTRRLVGEPRADNANLLKYVTRIPGWTKVREFDFPHKRAALLVCDRDTFFREAAFV